MSGFQRHKFYKWYKNQSNQRPKLKKKKKQSGPCFSKEFASSLDTNILSKSMSYLKISKNTSNGLVTSRQDCKSYPIQFIKNFRNISKRCDSFQGLLQDLRRRIQQQKGLSFVRRTLLGWNSTEARWDNSIWGRQSILFVLFLICTELTSKTIILGSCM